MFGTNGGVLTCKVRQYFFDAVRMYTNFLNIIKFKLFLTIAGLAIYTQVCSCRSADTPL